MNCIKKWIDIYNQYFKEAYHNEKTLKHFFYHIY